MTSPTPASDRAATHASGAQNFFERYAALGWVFFGAFIGLEAIRRGISGEVPPDLSAYIAAAQTFGEGKNPYGPALFEAPGYGGYVYIYPPGTLPLVSWLAFIPARVISVADALGHAAALTAALAWLRRYFSLPAPLGWLAALTAALYTPATTDLLAGNVVTYMLAAFLGCMALAYHPAPGRRHLAYAGFLGLVLAFKPMWGIPAGLVFLVRRQWALAGALLAGALAVAALSLVPWHGALLVEPWAARIASVRSQYNSVDLLSLAPGLLPLVALGWAAAGALLVRKRGASHPELWLWGATSLIAWPRLGTYSYLLAIPILCYLWRRQGFKSALLAALPAVVGLAALQLLLPESRGEFAYRVLLYAWAWLLAALTFWALWRPAKSRPQSACGQH